MLGPAARRPVPAQYRGASAPCRAFGIVIGLENPGDGSESLFNIAQEGVALTRRFGSHGWG